MTATNINPINLNKMSKIVITNELYNSILESLKDNQLINDLQKYVSPYVNGEKIIIEWSILDIKNDTLDTFDKINILENIERHHDASQGISWETINAEVEQYISSKH